MSEPTVSDPAWCRGYDAGYFIGLRVGAGRERAAIVAMLRNPIWADMPALLISDHIERGEHTWPDVE